MSVLLILVLFSHFQPHQSRPSIPDIINHLGRQFNWEMWNFEQTRLIRQGSRSSQYGLDSLNLIIKESFADSNIEMNGMLGYNSKDSLFYAASVFNVDLGPHVMKGNLISSNEIRFVEENTGTVNILTVLNGNNHFWTSFKKRDNGSLERNDIKIIFTRKTK